MKKERRPVAASFCWVDLGDELRCKKRAVEESVWQEVFKTTACERMLVLGWLRKACTEGEKIASHPGNLSMLRAVNQQTRSAHVFCCVLLSERASARCYSTNLVFARWET